MIAYAQNHGWGWSAFMWNGGRARQLGLCRLGGQSGGREVEVLELLRHAVQGVPFRGAGTLQHDHVPQIWLPREPLKCGRETIRIPRREEETVLTVTEVLPRATGARRDDWNPTCHGLQGNEPEGLIPFAREHQYV